MNRLLLIAIGIALAALIGQPAGAQAIPTDLISTQKEDQRHGGLGRTRGSQSEQKSDGDAEDQRKDDQDKRKPRKDKRDD